MDTPISVLETKLYVPERRRGLVARPRLVERLRLGAEGKLTVVSAPPGFGKTTLIAGWLGAAARDGTSAAWLSLDPSDNDPRVFWTYVISALQTVAPGVGSTAHSLLGSDQWQIDGALGTLLNDVAALSNAVVLVLDDYHVINAREIHDGMAFLLEHLPPRLHVVIASRTDPPLPLSRMRARGDLVEVRAADLRFTQDEADAYLNEVMGLQLAARDVRALEMRTEGWIAALQLAALSMQGRDDVAGFIAGFAGDDRYIVDYLVEEVLHRQPEQVRTFLLQTSILSRLNGPLCDAVTCQDGGRTMLESLDRENLFLVPLDDRRRWYRYHQLFADVLRARVLDEQPGLVPDLHRRASQWYEHNGEQSEAIRHALAAEDLFRVADLAEMALPAMRRNRQATAFLGWLDALPDDLVRVRPVLSVGYAWALLEAGRLELVEVRLRDAERWLDMPARTRSAEMVVVNDDEFRDLPATIAVYRAALAQAAGDVAQTIKHAQRVLILAPEDEHLRRGSALAFLGLAHWTTGDLEAAHRSFADGMAEVLRAGHVSDAISGATVLADFRIAQGRLHDAARIYERALQLAAEQGEPVPRGTADMYVGLSELDREHGDLDRATQHLGQSKALGERTGSRPNECRWRIAMARIRESQGDPDGALDLLQEAERLYVKDFFFPNVRPVAAFRTRVWVAQGRLAEAVGWAREQGLSATDDVSYLHEFAHITLARVLLAEGATVEAIGFLERLLNAAEEGERTGSAIEILVLLALAQQMRGDVPAGLMPLGRALALAEPEGYVRMFLDEGPAMAALLEAAAKKGITPNYVRQLLAAFDGAAVRMPMQQALIEPLSERELEVLRLLASDLDGPDIARRLVVSLNTVRSHTRSIYAKLGVNSRRAAVRRAEDLRLLPATHDR